MLARFDPLEDGHMPTEPTARSTQLDAVADVLIEPARKALLTYMNEEYRSVLA